MPFFAELKRRNVFKVGVVYAIVAWLIAQVISVIQNPLHLPAGFDTAVIILLIVGFPLALIFAWAFELTPQGIKPTKEIDKAESITHITGQKLNYSIIVLLSLAVVFLIIDNYVVKEVRSQKSEVRIKNNSESTTSSETAASDKGPGTSDNKEPSVAVLPFEDLSPKKDQGYFADGIAEELLNSLAAIKDLKVAGRTSSFYFKGKNEDLRKIGEMLDVENILEGSVRKAGNKVRITAQLNNARTGYHLWSKTYDRTLDDIFTIQEDIAKSVAETLQISLGVGKLGHDLGMTHNVEAYDDYLAGRSHMQNLTRENLVMAIEKFEQAVALDPGFAVAWNELAGDYTYAAAGFITERAAEFTKKAEAATSRAIALAPESLSSLLAAAQQHIQHREWSAAELLFEKATAQAPGDYLTNIRFGQFLLNVGRPRKAVEYIQRAIRAEPLRVLPTRNLGFAYEESGNLDAARNQYERSKTLAIGDTSVTDGFILLLAMATNNRDYVDAFLEKTVNNDIASPEMRSLEHLFLDNPEDARSALHRYYEDPAHNNNYMVLNNIGLWAAYFDDPDLALQAYQRESGFPAFSPMFLWRAVLKEMRRLQGFKDIVKDLKLVDYWRTSGNWGEFCRPVGEDDFECE